MLQIIQSASSCHASLVNYITKSRAKGLAEVLAQQAAPAFLCNAHLSVCTCQLGNRVAVRCQSLQERQRRKLPLIGMGQFLGACTGGWAQGQAHGQVQAGMFICSQGDYWVFPVVFVFSGGQEAEPIIVSAGSMLSMLCLTPI